MTQTGLEARVASAALAWLAAEDDLFEARRPKERDQARMEAMQALQRVRKATRALQRAELPMGKEEELLALGTDHHAILDYLETHDVSGLFETLPVVEDPPPAVRTRRGKHDA